MSADHIEPVQLRLTLELCVPSDIRFIEGIVALIQRQCREVGFPSSKCSLNIPVALSEALANAILRANKENPSKQVYVLSALDNDRLV
ncbi:MAG: ATP-binding protein, partial [Gemmatimonadaceae bacterium]